MSTTTTVIYTLSLHDALPISIGLCHSVQHTSQHLADCLGEDIADIDYISAGINHVAFLDRKSTRLNSSHMSISYAVFCLKKKNNIHTHVYEHTYQNKTNVSDI